MSNRLKLAPVCAIESAALELAARRRVIMERLADEFDMLSRGVPSVHDIGAAWSQWGVGVPRRAYDPAKTPMTRRGMLGLARG